MKWSTPHVLPLGGAQGSEANTTGTPNDDTEDPTANLS